MKIELRNALLFFGCLFGVVALLIVLNRAPADDGANSDNVNIVDGIQVINVTAKGGYNPRTLTAQAGIATELRVNTQGTFDCSSALVIPSLGVRTMLEPTGTATFPIAAEDAQGTLEAMCSMGMYRFTVQFL